jgi:hypothetical protein
MWEFLPPRVRLRGLPRPGPQHAQRLAEDFEKFRDGLPPQRESYILSAYGLDLASVHGGLRVKNPFGKASGQLSLARHQVEKDAEGRLGFVALKTVIAHDPSGGQTMREWAIPETRMVVERIRGRSSEAKWLDTRSVGGARAPIILAPGWPGTSWPPAHCSRNFCVAARGTRSSLIA